MDSALSPPFAAKGLLKDEPDWAPVLLPAFALEPPKEKLKLPPAGVPVGLLPTLLFPKILPPLPLGRLFEG